MFSGIVAGVGEVVGSSPAAAGRRLSVRAPFLTGLAPGASVAVNGVCLTVEGIEGGVFEATAVDETVARTNLGQLLAGDRVNLEGALRVGDELGGHWVQGHVDGVGRVVSITRGPGDVRLALEVPPALRRFVAVKGSMAVDGASLTIASWNDPILEIALVPYTLAHTIADRYRPGTCVNLEADLLARYLERLLESRERLPEPSEAAPQGGGGRR